MRNGIHGDASPREICRSPQIIGFLLAGLATSTSIWITVIAGMERGGNASEHVAWAAVGVVLLLGAHLIPALSRQSPSKLRTAAWALWFVCMLSTGYGHATFFLTAQAHAGDMRAADVRRSTPTRQHVPNGRTLSAIAADQARVKQALIAVRSTRCTMSCRSLEVRRETLSIQLAALDVEAREALRERQLADRALASADAELNREERARVDPVTARAATLLGLSRDSVDLAIAVIFGTLLECVACIGWMLGLANQLQAADVNTGLVSDDPVEFDSRTIRPITVRSGDVPSPSEDPKRLAPSHPPPWPSGCRRGK